ncbi:6,7-dimethyl-8-ribityllumazine synthase [Methylocapsa sp. S129]|uniref:6,7-dimethyl-8-ribityllumazine synthase n=1 Tax=Methylocapsa sp. S129 TaxID=1641869 RepID=UPI00131D8E50|nr:6,7-dimethyl-8-ribityllumazine synthase [Methylocapsa sp. S129]
MAEPRRDVSKPPAMLSGGRILIVEARFYEAIGAQLLDGAQRAIAAAGASSEIINVPGALEIPIAIAIALDAAAEAGEPYDGAVALGCVIRGETYHFEIVAGESSRALIELAVARRLALGNGILTVENEAQAEARADPARGDKGGDAARAAIVLAALKRDLGAKFSGAKKPGAAK